MTDHAFGGPWTEIKLDAIEYYLKCYTGALAKRGFDLWYFDAFAGTGERTASKTTGGLFEKAPIDTIQETLDGSARRAIQIIPPFHHYVFIEEDEKRCTALEKIKKDYPSMDIQVIRGDANSVLCDLIQKRPWDKKDNGSARGVVFLDPYALQVSWATLQALASTKVFDVWYLFPIRDTIRQLAHDFKGVGPKESALDRVLGTHWRELYSIAPDHGADFFTIPTEPKLQRAVSQKQFENWLKQKLEAEFSFVSKPLPLLTSPNRQAFSLFLGVSNPKKAATDLAKKFVQYVNKNFAPGASRHKSAL